MNDIVIGEGSKSYVVDTNLSLVAAYIDYLQIGSNQELEEIFKIIGVDKKTRAKVENIIKQSSKDKKLRTLRNINKALSLELLSSFYWRFIDKPIQVKANCSTKEDKSGNFVPNNFAPRGKCDIEVDYDGYKLVIEVSSKTNMTSKQYVAQVNSAKKHAERIRDSGYDEPIYCLLINEKTMKEEEIKGSLVTAQKESNGIYFTSMSIGEFSRLGDELSEGNKSKKISSASVQQCFKNAAQSLYNQEYIPLDKLLADKAKEEKKGMNLGF